MEFTFQNDYGADYWMERAFAIGDVMEMMYPESADSYDISDAFESMFEASDGDGSASNEKVSKSFIQSIKNAYEAIIRKLKEIVERITGFFKKRFSGKAASEEIKNMQETLDENPELKSEKVEIEDVAKISQVYSSAEKEAKKAFDAAEKADATVDELNSTFSKIKGYVTKALPSAVLAIGAGAALALVTRFSGVVDNTIKSANARMDDLEKNLTAAISGDGSVKKKKRRLAYDRFLGWISGEKNRTVTGGFFKGLREIKSVITGKGGGRTRLVTKVATSKVAKSAIRAYGDIAGALQDRRAAEEAALERAKKREEKEKKKRLKNIKVTDDVIDIPNER